MYLDILIFALVAAFLVYRLNSVLGTRHDGDRPRGNPFAAPEKKPARPMPVIVKPVPVLQNLGAYIDEKANKDGRIETGLEEIRAADPSFDIDNFMAGARYAFEAIVKAYADGDRAALKPLLSPKLYADFEAGLRAREEAGHVSTTEIHRILASRIVEAHLGGTMAYITVDYDVEQTTVTRDKNGAVVEGSPDHITTVEDIWTFTRDTRAQDPNWMLIETRAAEKTQ